MPRLFRAALTVVPLAMLTLLAATACGSTAWSGASEASDAGRDKVKLGVIPIVDVAPIHLGEAKGFFTEEDIDLEIVNTTGGAAAIPGVVSGELDFAFGNVVSLILARSQGLPLKAVAEGTSSTAEQGADYSAVVVPADSPIKTAADLEGGTVAVNNLKNIGDTTVRASIRAAGGDPTKVRFVELAFPDMPAAVEQRRVDAAWIIEPFLTLTQQQGARVIASNYVDAASNLTVAVYFTTEKVIRERADLNRRFVAAVEKSLEYAQGHPDEARAALLGYTKIDEAVAKELTLPSWAGGIDRESVQTLADLMHGDGLLKEKFDVAAVLP